MISKETFGQLLEVDHHWEVAEVEYDFEKSEIKVRFPQPASTAKPVNGKAAAATVKPAEAKKTEAKPAPNPPKSP